MADEATVTLPSGCQITLRPLRLSEESILGKGGAGRQVVQKMVEACTVRVDDPGPYPSPAWDTMLMGDQMAALLELRCISYPSGHLYTVQGVRCPACRQASGYEIDLKADLYRRELDEVGAEHLTTGAPLTTTIDGHTVSFVLPTPETERLRERNDKQRPGRPGNRLRARIRAVEGIAPHDILAWLDGGDPKAPYPGLTMGDVDLLETAMDAHDCGYDLDMELTCPRGDCGHTFTIALPFLGSFNRPALAAARAARRASSGD